VKKYIAMTPGKDVDVFHPLFSEPVLKRYVQQLSISDIS